MGGGASAACIPEQLDCGLRGDHHEILMAAWASASAGRAEGFIQVRDLTTLVRALGPPPLGCGRSSVSEEDLEAFVMALDLRVSHVSDDDVGAQPILFHDIGVALARRISERPAVGSDAAHALQLGAFYATERRRRREAAGSPPLASTVVV